jgi:uncharacterized repeat protein (TIGR03803 family)
MLKKVLSVLPLVLVLTLLPASSFAQVDLGQVHSEKNNSVRKPNCSGAACAKPAATSKVSEVALKGGSGSNFALTPNTFTVLYGFVAGGTDAAAPKSALVQDASGNLYGTAGGGSIANGAIWELNTSGTETVLYNFGGRSGGAGPVAGLTMDSAGNLFGAAVNGGSRGKGTVFELAPPYTAVTTLHTFTTVGTDGWNPYSGLAMDSAGNLYGTTASDSVNACFSAEGYAMGCGMVFELSPSGTETLLYNFKGGFTAGGSDGQTPYNYGTLLRDSSGNLYGTTSSGGASVNTTAGNGIVFKVDPSGNETVLYNFLGGTTDGCYPYGSVIQDASGNLYGTTSSCGNGGNPGSGTPGNGTIWKLTPEGVETVLYNFTDLATPLAGLTMDSSGNLYGVTEFGGPAELGQLYKLSPDGTFTVLHNFDGSNDGSTPIGTVLIGSDGNLYGSAATNGPNGGGTVWGYGLSQPSQTLTVTLAGTGTGIVSSSPAGITCPGTCSALFPQGTVVTLAETPGTNSTFGDWSGACSGSASACQVTLTQSASVTALFTANLQTTATSLTSSQNPGPYGQAVVFTATVTPQSSGTPTGIVTFYDGTAALGVQSLSGGTAQYSTSNLTAGSHSITAVYGGDSNYQGSSSSPLSQTINPATTTVIWSIPTAITYGTALSATQLNATAAPVSAGTYVYTPSAGTVLNAGSQSLSVTFTPSDSNYAASTGSVTLQVNAAATTVIWSTPTAITYGTALSATQLNATAAPVSAGTYIYTPSAGTVLNAGSQSLSVTFTPSNNNYAASTGTVTLQVNPAATSVVWSTPPAITYGTPLNASQLNATATPVSAGTYVYTPSAGTVLNVGSQNLSVQFTPGSGNYAASTGSVTLQVNAASQTITFPVIPTETYGASITLGATASSGLPVSYAVISGPATINGSILTTTGLGSVTVQASQAGNTNYTAASPVSRTFTVKQASQTITFTESAPTTAPYNSSFTVAATSSSGLPVSFSSAGACTNADATYTMISGAGTCSVIVIQAGNSDYLAAKVTKTTRAARIAPTVSFTGAPSSAPYQSTFTVDTTSNAGITPTITTSGACSINGTTVTMTSGTGTCTMTARWALNSDYLAASATQATTAEKVTSTISWPTPNPIPYGTALSAAQLNATASVAGKFTYTPAAGTVLNAGAQTLSVKFAPTLSTDYTVATASAELTVNPVDTTTTITTTTPNPSKTGQAVTVAFTVAQAVTNVHKPTGSVTLTASSGETCTGTLVAGGKGSCKLTFTTAGSRTLTAAYTGDSNNNGSTSVAVTQAVN